MMTPTVLKSVGWVAVAGAIVAVISCRDFDQAYYEQCVEKNLCYVEGEDAGTDGGNNPGNDAGTDGGNNPQTDGGNNPQTDGGNNPQTDGGNNPQTDGGNNPSDAGDPDAGDPDGGGTFPGPDGGSGYDGGGGLDGSTPVTDGPMVDQQARRAAGCAAELCLRDEYTLAGPYELQGLWASSPDEVFLAARARPGVEAPAQVVRFSGGNFSASTVNVPGFQPFRLRGSGPTNLWAINEAPSTGAFYFDGQSWRPAGHVTNRATLMAPAFYVGPTSLEGEPFVAIAGPDEKNLYAATASRVLRWVPGTGWRTESLLPRLRGLAPSVQDLWVNRDGSDVWVTLKTSYVLRKHDGQWGVVHLPVDPSFSALQVQGFDTPAGDLWITGTWTSGLSHGTSAYRYERRDP